MKRNKEEVSKKTGEGREGETVEEGEREQKRSKKRRKGRLRKM